MKNSRIMRILALALAVLFLLENSMCGRVMAAEAEAVQAEEVQLYTADDLKELSEKSVYDSYTRGRIFRLMNDIDLTGADFSPISIFCGTFEGDNHKIRGLHLTDTGSDYGFFRFVEADGVVQNLMVEGIVEPGGTKKNIGGIAGTNKGIIRNCYYQGSVVARETVGGIVGHNEAGGLLVGCGNYAMVTATKRSGGIAGYNEGGISGCINQGKINTTVESISRDEEELSLELTLNREMLVDEEKVNFTGGIAGISSGLIEDSRNYGLIGYPHVGYHVGGIAGYQNGCIKNSYNYGNIRGRKDIGGIVGLFEPYVELTYATDMLRELRGQMDDVSAALKELSDAAGSAGDKLSENLEQVGESGGAVGDTIREQKNYYADQEKQFDEAYQEAGRKVEDRLDKLELEIEGEAAVRAIGEIRSDTAQMKETAVKLAAIQAIEEQLANNTGLTEEQRIALQDALNQLGDKAVLEACLDTLLAEISGQVDFLERTASDAVDEVDDFAGDLHKLREETGDLSDVIKANIRSLKKDLEKTDEAISEQNDAVRNDLEALQQGTRESRQEIEEKIDQIERQMDDVNDTISDGFDRLDERLNSEDVFSFTDLSDSDNMENRHGLVAQCRNSGEITADINGGGIAGAIAIETDMESEFAIHKIGTRSMNQSGTEKATILQCINDSDITVKNDYAGGIVGRSDRGAAISCKNYGNIETVDGSYTGGIMGKSSYLIRDCYALCRVTGNDYTGGITGYGAAVVGNYVMATVESKTKESFGAIAGIVEERAEDNCFVEEGIAAINGLTYERQARPITYEELLEMSGTPDEYRSFHVKFMADNTVIKEITCQYGENVKDSEIPAVPKKAGCYGIWEEESLLHINRNITVHAIYGAWITTISAAGEEKPSLLVSADFFPDARLTYQKLPVEQYTKEGYEVIAAYDFTLTSEHQQDYGALRVRVASPKAKRQLCAAWVQEGEIRILDTEVDGSYLVFAMNQPGTFLILEQNADHTIWITAGLAVFVILLVMAVVRHRKKSRQKREKKNEEEQNMEE